jgi:hypothetical protein
VIISEEQRGEEREDQRARNATHPPTHFACQARGSPCRDGPANFYFLARPPGLPFLPRPPPAPSASPCVLPLASLSTLTPTLTHSLHIDSVQKLTFILKTPATSHPSLSLLTLDSSNSSFISPLSCVCACSCSPVFRIIDRQKG